MLQQICSQAKASNSATTPSSSQTFEPLQPLELLEPLKPLQSQTLKLQTATQLQMAASFCMPMHNEHATPMFDSSKLHELP